MQCHHFDLSDFDCEENTNVPRVRHGGELRERLYTTVCVDGAQAGVGGVDSWGSLPLIKYRLTLKGPIEWTFAMQPFGTRQVTKLPSLLEKTRRLREREILDSPRVGRRLESLSLSEQGPGSEAGEPVPQAAAATRAVYDRDPDSSRAPTPPPTSPTRDRSQTPPPPEALELKEPTVLARALRLRLAPDTASARPFGRDGGGGRLGSPGAATARALGAGGALPADFAVARCRGVFVSNAAECDAHGLAARVPPKFKLVGRAVTQGRGGSRRKLVAGLPCRAYALADLL